MAVKAKYIAKWDKDYFGNPSGDNAIWYGPFNTEADAHKWMTERAKPAISSVTVRPCIPIELLNAVRS